MAGANEIEHIKTANHKMTVTLPDGSKVPRLGQGTWHMAEQPIKYGEEVEALRLGIELGLTLIDTAEMYAGGKAEILTGEAIRCFPREALFIVSKVYPHHAGRKNIFGCCEASLKRLGLCFLDLYLLHWRGSVPLSETVACMNELVSQGLIRRWGVSNFDTEDMQELMEIPGGDRCAVNQVLYHLGSRGVEYDLLPWMKAHGIPMMAYCPTAQAGALELGILNAGAVRKVAEKFGITPVQVLLAFALYRKDVIAIPKSGTAGHTLENAKAGTIRLDDGDLALLNAVYPPPDRKMRLDIV